MKVKTSITLSEEILKKIEKRAKKRRKSRSAFIERLERRALNARDIHLIDRNADSLNAEAVDVLHYQVIS